mgnify:CR=1 FL=1
MTAATLPTPDVAPQAGAPRAPARGWLYGPVPDLLLGCGLAYAAFFLVLAYSGDGVRRLVPFELAPLLALATGAPHYGATLLRVYERREDRQAYRVFTVHLTALVWTLFVASLTSPLVGSIVLTIYLTWSPWHYTGQNYGIGLLFLHRRGVPVSPLAKRLLHASFVLSFLLTAAAIHGVQHGADYAPASYEGTQFRLLPLGIPPAVGDVLFYGLGAGYLLCLAAAGGLLARSARLRDLGPTAAIVLTQSLWFAVPVLARHAGALQGIDPLSTTHAAYTFLWIAAAHAVQYLWVSSYFARVGGRAPSQVGYLGKALLAGAAIWVVPALLFAPGLVGRLPYDAGLAVMVAAAVNLHHFLLDGAIWKLRDGRVARILVRGGRDAASDTCAAPRRRVPLWPAGAALGTFSVFVLAYGTVEQELGVRSALDRGDLSRAHAGIERLRWIGRDGPALRVAYGLAAADAGHFDEARRALERALALHPGVESWRALGSVELRAGDERAAVRAYREALALQPESADVANDLAWIRATSRDPALRNPAEAVRLAESAARATGHQRAEILDTLAAAYASSLRLPEAVHAAQRAADLAWRAGNAALAADITTRLEAYQADPRATSARRR